MATITGLTAERMLEIEGASIVDAEVRSGDLILIKHDGNEINIGPIIGPPGPVGPQGPAAVSAIPGEVKLWSGDELPDLATYGKWVWADGAVYPNASHPLAAGHIASEWRVFAGASDPGASNFRVPDLRGLVASGMDAMPGGTRANRMTRGDAIILAKKTGKETHAITIPEMAAHNHGSGGADLGNLVNIAGTATPAGAHAHTTYLSYNDIDVASAAGGSSRVTGLGALTTLEHDVSGPGSTNGDHSHSVSGSGTIASKGSGAAHENVQPTVFVPYIVYLDVV